MKIVKKIEDFKKEQLALGTSGGIVRARCYDDFASIVNKYNNNADKSLLEEHFFTKKAVHKVCMAIKRGSVYIDGDCFTQGGGGCFYDYFCKKLYENEEGKICANEHDNSDIYVD